MPMFQSMHYLDSAPEDMTREVLILLHGFFMDSRMFAPQIQHFSRRFRVICPDLRGFGASAIPTEPFSLYDEVRDVMALADHLGIERFHLGGMSKGGYLALRAALRNRQRLLSLILIATQSQRDNPETVTQFQQLRDNWAQKDIRNSIIETLLPVIIGDNDAVKNTWRPIWQALDPQAIALAMNAMTERDDIDVSAIELPCAIIHGLDDQGIPVQAALKNRKAIDGARLCLVTGACHAVNLTHPEPVNAFLDDFFDSLVEKESSFK